MKPKAKQIKNTKYEKEEGNEDHTYAMAIDSFFLYFNALKGEREYHLSVRKTTKTTRKQRENNKKTTKTTILIEEEKQILI